MKIRYPNYEILKFVLVIGAVLYLIILSYVPIVLDADFRQSFACIFGMIVIVVFVGYNILWREFYFDTIARKCIVKKKFLFFNVTTDEIDFDRIELNIKKTWIGCFWDEGYGTVWRLYLKGNEASFIIADRIRKSSLEQLVSKIKALF